MLKFTWHLKFKLNSRVSLLLFLSLSVSANTNFEDLDAWKNVPVKALEQHPYWRNLYAIKATHPQGDEYRVLINRMVNPNIKACHKSEEGLLYHSPECAKKDPCVMEFDGSYPSLVKYLDCSKNDHGCNNVFDSLRNGELFSSSRKLPFSPKAET